MESNFKQGATYVISAEFGKSRQGDSRTEAMHDKEVKQGRKSPYESIKFILSQKFAFCNHQNFQTFRSRLKCNFPRHTAKITDLWLNWNSGG